MISLDVIKYNFTLSSILIGRIDFSFTDDDALYNPTCVQYNANMKYESFAHAAFNVCRSLAFSLTHFRSKDFFFHFRY